MWPSRDIASQSYAATFFGRNFQSRPAAFKTDYKEDCFLEGVSEKFLRPLTYGGVLQEGEVLCRLDITTNAIEVWAEEIPLYGPTQYRFAAVQLVQANVRMVLYSLNIEKIEHEFERLKTTVSGWSMAGSNMLTRTGCTETAENCASLVFRCLNAGGLSSSIATRLSSTTSSAVTPDDLLRCIVALKETELDEYPEVEEFTVFKVNVRITSLGNSRPLART